MPSEKYNVVKRGFFLLFSTKYCFFWAFPQSIRQILTNYVLFYVLFLRSLFAFCVLFFFFPLPRFIPHQQEWRIPENTHIKRQKNLKNNCEDSAFRFCFLIRKVHNRGTSKTEQWKPTRAKIT